MAPMLLFMCLIFLTIQPSLLQMPFQTEVLYSHDTPKHWQSLFAGFKMVDWPTKQLDPTTQSYTEEDLKDWFCVNHKDQLNDGTLFRFVDSRRNHYTCVYANYEGMGPRLMMLSFLVRLGAPLVNYRYIAVDKDKLSSDKERKTWGRDCFADDDVQAHYSHPLFKDESYAKVTPVCKKTYGVTGLKGWYLATYTCAAAQGQKEFWQPKMLPDKFAAADKRGILTIGNVLPFAYKCDFPKNGTKASFCWNSRRDYLLLHKDDIKPSELSKVTKCWEVPYPEDPLPSTTPKPNIPVK